MAKPVIHSISRNPSRAIAYGNSGSKIYPASMTNKEIIDDYCYVPTVTPSIPKEIKKVVKEQVKKIPKYPKTKGEYIAKIRSMDKDAMLNEFERVGISCNDCDETGTCVCDLKRGKMITLLTNRFNSFK